MGLEMEGRGRDLIDSKRQDMHNITSKEKKRAKRTTHKIYNLRTCHPPSKRSP